MADWFSDTRVKDTNKKSNDIRMNVFPVQSEGKYDLNKMSVYAVGLQSGVTLLYRLIDK